MTGVQTCALPILSGLRVSRDAMGVNRLAVLDQDFDLGARHRVVDGIYEHAAFAEHTHQPAEAVTPAAQVYANRNLNSRITAAVRLRPDHVHILYPPGGPGHAAERQAEHPLSLRRASRHARCDTGSRIPSLSRVSGKLLRSRSCR